MNILHLKQEHFVTSRWSGGTTTELFIWPEGANYANREFTVRISSAAVELTESDFTPLEGVVRYITPLAGGFTLTHPGKAPIVMAPLDQPYRFSGEEATHCVGTATDFNLMLKGAEGEMCLRSGTTPIRPGLNAFYAPESRTFRLNGTDYPLAAGEMLVVLAEKAAKIYLGDGPTICCFAAI